MLKARHQKTNEYNVQLMHVTSFTTMNGDRKLSTQAFTRTLRIVTYARLKFMDVETPDTLAMIAILCVQQTVRRGGVTSTRDTVLVVFQDTRTKAVNIYVTR